MKVLKFVVWGLLVFVCSTSASAKDTANSDSDPQTQGSTNAARDKKDMPQEQQKADDSKNRSAPIESFVPSEKVSPDRSISFPVDI